MEMKTLGSEYTCKHMDDDAILMLLVTLCVVSSDTEVVEVC